MLIPSEEVCVCIPTGSMARDWTSLVPMGFFPRGQEGQKGHTRTQPFFDSALFSAVDGRDGGLRWSYVAHGSVQLTTETSAFSRYLLACLITERRYDFCEFERSKQAVVVLPVYDYVIVRGQQLLKDTRRCLFI